VRSDDIFDFAKILTRRREDRRPMRRRSQIAQIPQMEDERDDVRVKSRRGSSWLSVFGLHPRPLPVLICGICTQASSIFVFATIFSRRSRSQRRAGQPQISQIPQMKAEKKAAGVRSGRQERKLRLFWLPPDRLSSLHLRESVKSAVVVLLCDCLPSPWLRLAAMGNL
jgi:hypothetical protein